MHAGRRRERVQNRVREERAGIEYRGESGAIRPGESDSAGKFPTRERLVCILRNDFQSRRSRELIRRGIMLHAVAALLP